MQGVETNRGAATVDTETCDEQTIKEASTDVEAYIKPATNVISNADAMLCEQPVNTVASKPIKHAKRLSIDRGLTVAKTLAFIVCLAVGVIPVIIGWQMKVIDWDLGFLVLFAAMTLGIFLYFTLGCAFLQRVVPNYRARLRLGERGHAGETAIMAIACNLGVHVATLLIRGIDPLSTVLVFTSLIFFSYPVHYLVTMFWNLQPEVRSILTGETKLNATHFANVPRQVISQDEYLPITISLPVYTESNEVIFKTIRQCQAAISAYQKTTGQKANLVVSDDGLAKMLGGQVSANDIEYCLAATPVNSFEQCRALNDASKTVQLVAPTDSDTAQLVAPNEANETVKLVTPKRMSKPDFTSDANYRAFVERVSFYRRENISFVARPLANRRGKFKKGGNLNYTYKLAKELEQGAELQALIAPSGSFADGCAEGEICIHELICLLDKDSGLAPGVLAATAPEFTADPNLAYTQHTTHADNENDNYFSWLQARFTGMVYRVSLTSKALQGLQVHLMGHNAFLRRSFLEDTGGWAEDRVSEDYAKALDAYSFGWHAKHIAFPGLEFSEQVCDSFVEETDKQLRYCYGISEVVLGGRHRLPAAMFADMLLYYLSYFNLAAALPLIVLLLTTHQIYYLFAGILINAVLFLVLPVAQGWLMGEAGGFPKRRDTVRYFALNTLSFLGHSYSMLRGFAVYFTDRVRSSYEPFGATSVDKNEHSFAVGVALLKSYLRRNAPVLVAWSVIAVGSVFVLQDIPPHVVRPLIVAFLLAHVVAPIALTPQLFVRPKFAALKRLPKRVTAMFVPDKRLP